MADSKQGFVGAQGQQVGEGPFVERVEQGSGFRVEHRRVGRNADASAAQHRPGPVGRRKGGASTSGALSNTQSARIAPASVMTSYVPLSRRSTEWAEARSHSMGVVLSCVWCYGLGRHLRHPGFPPASDGEPVVEGRNVAPVAPVNGRPFWRRARVDDRGPSG